MDRAVGFSVHTGWAACVVASGTLGAPRVVARERVELLRHPERFLFHRAAELDLASAERMLADAERQSNAQADAAIAALLAHGRPIASAVVAKSPALGSLAEILASHPKIHSAEGRFYRDVLGGALRRAGIAVRVVSPAELERAAASAMKLDARRIEPLLAAAGKVVGRPWGKDQRLAALGAWLVLAA